MADYDGSIRFDTRIDDSGLPAQMKTLQGKLKASFATMRDVMQGPIAALGMAANAAKAMASQLDSMIMSAAASDKAMANLRAVLASTGGVSGMTASKLSDLASEMAELTLFEDDAVMQSNAVLLTFKEIGKDVFPQATKAISDMATVMGMDLQNATVMVGKALNDPIQGISALRRVGVQLTNTQEEQIKQFMKMNDVASAQAVIMKELNSQFGGAAEAAAKTATGQFQQMKKAMGELNEAFGRFLANTVEWEAFTKGINKIGNAVDLATDYNIALKSLAKDGATSTVQVYENAIKKVDELLKQSKTIVAGTPFGGTKTVQTGGKDSPELLQQKKDFQRMLENAKALEAAELRKQRIRQQGIDQEAKAQSEREAAEAKRIASMDDAWAREAERIRVQKQNDEEAIRQINEEKDAIRSSADEAGDAIKLMTDDSMARLTELAGMFGQLATMLNAIAGDEAGEKLSKLMQTVQAITQAAASGFQDVNADIQAITALISLAGEGSTEKFAEMQSEFAEITDEVFTALGPLFDLILDVVLVLLQTASPLLDILAPLIQLITPILRIVTDLIGPMLQLYMVFSGLSIALPLLIPIIELIADAITWLYNKVVVPTYNFLITGFNKIHNGFASLINGLLQMLDDIPGVDLKYRVQIKDENAGTLGEMTTGGETGASSDLEKANKALKENRELFTLATRAADAYAAVMAKTVDSIAGFYDGLKNIGADIAKELTKGLINGFGREDFLFAMEEYIRESVIQAAVFTDAFMAEVSSIGAAIARGIAGGMSENELAALKDRLAALYENAAVLADNASNIVAGAFNSYSVGTLGVDGDQFALLHNREAVLTEGIMAEARASGIFIGPVGNLGGVGALMGSRMPGNALTLNAMGILNVDGREIGRVAFQWSDQFAEVAYGS